MGNSQRQDLARRKSIAVLDELRSQIDEDFDGINEAAAEIGIPQSTFYRLMKHTPDKIDVVFLAQVADWLHENRGREDFAVLWRRVTQGIH